MRRLIYQFMYFCLFNKVRNKRKHARQCSVISVSAYCILPSALWCDVVLTFSHTDTTANNFLFEDHSEARTRLDNLKRSSFQLHGFFMRLWRTQVVGPYPVPLFWKSLNLLYCTGIVFRCCIATEMESKTLS